MDLTCIAFGIIFIVIGIVFAIGKGHIHLKAWQNMTEEEKAEIIIEPLCRNIGSVIALSGIIFLFKGFLADNESNWFTIAMIAWFIIAGVDVYLINKKEKNNKA